MDLKCAICGKGGSKNCSVCKSVAYCNQAHQKEDWSQHKIQCKMLKEQNANLTQNKTVS